MPAVTSTKNDTRTPKPQQSQMGKFRFEPLNVSRIWVSLPVFSCELDPVQPPKIYQPDWVGVSGFGRMTN